MNNKTKTIVRAQTDFYYFVTHVFSQSQSLFPNGFTDGAYIKQVCDQISQNSKTARVSARDHFKSTAFYAHYMHNLIKNWTQDVEGHYFSYQQKMAGYHVSKIKQAIKSNPYYDGIIDKKKNAESVIKYTWDGKHVHTLEPHGLLEFKRGIHAPLLYVDDPFQDPASKMVITVIKKINDVFVAQILDMAQDQLHVCGTPQTNDDFFFDDKIMGRFVTSVMPAEVNVKEQKALWPEWMGWDELQLRRKERGDKLYKQEYLCTPTHAAEAFINREQLYSLVNAGLENLVHFKKYDTDNDVVAGFDIGKKSHPAHFTVFELIKDKDRTIRRQLHHKFMDGWDYVDQLDYLVQSIENFGITELYYDDTRGEFESLKEQKKLPYCMKGVNFSKKTKQSMATSFDTAVTNGDIEFINDQRQLDQILLVTNDLQAIETPEGHADSFWSTALTFKFEEKLSPMITVI